MNGNECGKNNTNVAKIFCFGAKNKPQEQYSKKMLSQITMNEVDLLIDSPYNFFRGFIYLMIRD